MSCCFGQDGEVVGKGGRGGRWRFDGEMMAPLRDGDPPVFMNEPSPAGWSVMALRTNLQVDGESVPAVPSWLPPRPRCTSTSVPGTRGMTPS